MGAHRTARLDGTTDNAKPHQLPRSTGDIDMSEQAMARASTLPGPLTVLARALLSLPIIWSGCLKAAEPTLYQTNFAHLGLPLPMAAWAVAVTVEVAGGLALLFGIQTRVAASVLAVWCIATALVAHTNFADHNMQIHFEKNVVMAGGFLYVAAGRRGQRKTA
jgi:putative oxidoreductase